MKRSVKILWRVFIAGFALLALLFICANFGLFGKMPSVEQLQNPEADLASEIYTSDGILMGKYYSENRSEVKYNEISPNVINALLATEDERFYDHSGVDAQAVARAVFTLGTQGGGSTITQQVAKLMLKQGRGNIVKRVLDKMKEWIVAVK
ncbi:MAG: transglycosylase domain-containing protein, partial [Ferruginibacter sp.]